MLFNLPERGRYLIRACGNDTVVPTFVVFAPLA